MIKRMSKITSLLVAASAVLSLVPATGANASERLQTKDGTIEKVIAFKDGKYIYEGYKSDDDDSSVYFYDGSKDKELDDVEDADIDSAYDNKYAYLKDGSDEYLVDLTNGKISDDDTPEDQEDNVETKLASKLKKTDRYENKTTVDAARVSGISFGDTWYSYKATTTGDGTEDAVNGYLFGYTNQSGQYVDTSRLANIYTYSYAKNKVVKVSDYNDYDSDSELEVSLEKQPEFLTQDSDYIYSLVTVQVTTGKAAKTGEVDNRTTSSAVYIQKISKAQGDKKDDAYLPKNVTSYLVSNNVYDNGDIDDAYDYIVNGVYGDKDEDIYRVKNNKLYITGVSDSKNEVKVAIIDLKKIKEDTKTSFKDKNGNTISGKLDDYVAILNDDPDHDLIKSDDSKLSVSVDVDGNTWALDKGSILKLDGSNWKEIYTVDRSLNALNVYDENNLIAYENDGDVYTTVQEGKLSNDTDPTTPKQVGFVNTSEGWTFYDAAGNQVKNSWVNAGGSWYYMQSNGIMATGWLYVNGSWYYLNPISDGTKGIMKTGWLYIDGNWFYLDNSGAMKTGWQYISGSWFYLNPISDGTRGAMTTGWQYVNGSWYYLNPISDGTRGTMLSNTTVNGYRLGSSGALI